MIHAIKIKIALANMMRMAARDPLWAIVAFITFPLRYARSVVMGAFGYLFVVFTVYFGIDYLRRVMLGGHRGDVIWHVGDWVVMAFAVVLLIRLLSVPLITHFGSAVDDTHGSARFAGRREIAPLTKAGSGLPASGRSLRRSCAIMPIRNSSDCLASRTDKAGEMNQAVHITPMNRSARVLDAFAVAAAEDPS
ncbi:hypothetical protein HF265_29670 [Rhizobium leguminosarum]|nr:hypothetical protein [Rhizobium leguminosarum]